MAQAGISAKLHNLHTHGKLDHWLWDPLLFRKIKAIIGMDRVRRLISGGAPLSAHTMYFFRILLGAGCSVHEGYGLTGMCVCVCMYVALSSIIVIYPDYCTNNHTSHTHTHRDDRRHIPYTGR